MFKWIGRNSAPWSLDTLSLPWGKQQSLYERILHDPKAPLPDEDPARLKWAAGALDGVMGHHGGRGDTGEDVRRVLDAVRALLARATNSTLRGLYTAISDGQVLEYVDQLLPELERSFSSERGQLAALARLLVTKAPRREPVKFGIALLGIIGDAADTEAICQIGLCDDFTLFAAVAICNLSPDYEHELWELAKAVDGWGRIQVVERLAKTENVEIQGWLLREGFRNAVMNEYLACICARAGRLHVALRANPKDRELLESAADLLLALITGGPAEDIDDFEYAADAIEAYIDSVWTQSTFKPKHLVVLDRIREWLTSEEGWDTRAKGGWTPANRERCSALSQELLSSGDWKTWAVADLNSSDARTFHWANTAARKLGVDTWDVLFAKVKQDPVGSTFWYELTEATDEARIDRLIEFAEHAIPLQGIATGPSDEIGLGAGFEPHGTLDWMLQLIDKFPGRGWKLIRAGIQSPVVRNRHWSLRAFKNWGRADWPDDAVQVLRAAARSEPDEEIRLDLETLLNTIADSVQ